MGQCGAFLQFLVDMVHSGRGGGGSPPWTPSPLPPPLKQRPDPPPPLPESGWKVGGESAYGPLLSPPVGVPETEKLFSFGSVATLPALRTPTCILRPARLWKWIWSAILAATPS